MTIPEKLTPHRADLYPYAGTGPAGARFGDKVPELRCIVEDKVRTVRTPSGDLVQSSRAVYLEQREVPVLSEVDYLGSRRAVVAISQQRIGTRLANTVLYLA